MRLGFPTQNSRSHRRTCGVPEQAGGLLCSRRCACLSRSVGWCFVNFSPLGLRQVPHPLKTKQMTDKSKLEGQKEGLLNWQVSG